MKCEYGYCLTCEKEIAKKCATCGTKKLTEDYSEVEIQWSNGSRMKIAVCKECATNHVWTTPEAKKAITVAHWEAWDKVGGKYDMKIVVV